MATIYVSGGFYGQYKETIRARLGPPHRIIDPEADTRPMSRMPGRYVGRDLDGIEGARVVLAVHTDYPYVYGMAAEIGYAVGLVNGMALFGHRRDLDVIYVCLTKRVDSFLSGLARATFTDLGAACDFINERYT